MKREFEEDFLLEFYQLFVRGLIQDKSSQTLEFEGLVHTRVVLSGLTDTANKKINIFYNNLAEQIWFDPSVFRSVRGALERGVKFNVLVRDSVPSYLEDTFSRYGIPIRYTGKVALNTSNFVTSDDTAYALIDPNVRRGFACFNDPATTFKLKEIIE